MGLFLFDIDSDSEDESDLTKNECKRFHTITTLLAWTNGNCLDAKRKRKPPSTSYEGGVSRSMYSKIQEQEYSLQLLEHISNIIVRDNETLAIMPTERPHRRGKACQLTIAFNSDRKGDDNQNYRYTGSDTKVTGACIQTTSMTAIEGSNPTKESLSTWFYRHTGNNSPIEDHIIETLGLLRNSCRHVGRESSPTHDQRLNAYTILSLRHKILANFTDVNVGQGKYASPNSY
ncbi:hypothetical protein FKW77_007178 [Venturia effusa]|uniref:Uncharacterized protein n=1 Tax=Venturia effusa TaxID=50376 RepID=A0A517LPG5_9PEZI|nr:hypothetical protein FKW77_007178 [Venturia effusa]